MAVGYSLLQIACVDFKMAAADWNCATARQSTDKRALWRRELVQCKNATRL